jgi:hypothetical protein
MKQSYFNFLKMTGVTIAGMDKNTDKWTTETEISDVYNSIKKEYELIISKNDMVIGLETTGFTAAKDSTMESITASVYKLCRAMSAYAKSRGDSVLLASVDLSITGICKGPELEVISRCASIVELAEQNLPNLVSFKITAEKIASIREQFNAYKSYVGTRGTTRSTRTVGNSELDNQMSSLRKKVDILDDCIEALIEDETFLSEYTSWRMIIDYGKGKTLKNKATKTESAAAETPAVVKETSGENF